MTKQSVDSLESGNGLNRLPDFCIQRFGVYRTDLFRSIRASKGKYTFAFAIYGWPWFNRCFIYNTTAGEIIDSVGVIGWLIHARDTIRDGYKILHLRIACVAIGATWEVSHVR